MLRRYLAHVKGASKGPFMTTLNRRSFLTRSLAGAGPLVASGSVLVQPLLSSPKSELITATGKRRVVIAGGAWGGLAACTKIFY